MSYASEIRGRVRKFAVRYKLRNDWHEPDEEGVSAEVIGDHLDNAFGDSGTTDEFVVILKVNGKETERINLAGLLAAASGRK